jgi:hypothetical protein
MAAQTETHWRSGIDRPIAVLQREPEELENLGLGLRFEDDYDELDYLRHARLPTPSGRVYALVRHRSAPKPGTEVVTRVDSADFAADIAEVLDQLGLCRSDIAWAHPSIEEAWKRDLAIKTYQGIAGVLALDVLFGFFLILGLGAFHGLEQPRWRLGWLAASCVALFGAAQAAVILVYMAKEMHGVGALLRAARKSLKEVFLPRRRGLPQH